MQKRKVLLSLLLSLILGATTASAQMAAIVARDEPAEGAAGGPASANGAYGGGAKAAAGSAGRTSTKAKTTKSSAARSTAAKVNTPAKPRPWDGFVVGDKYTFLNFEVVSAEKPWYTRDAKANGAKGLVQVEVLIDTNGNVIQAKGRTGNKLLHPEAERAALASKFNRPTFGGKPARAIGFLVYRFGPADDDD
ncbi:MAG: energy transducer TonB [Pyrinomonadaceae bacterium]